MVVYNDVGVSIKVAGISLPVYIDPYSNNAANIGPPCHHLVERYVEARAGDEFAIHYGSRNSQRHAELAGMKYMIYIDGIKVGSWLVEGFPHTSYDEKIIQGKDGKYVERMLTFDQFKSMDPEFVTKQVEEEYKLKLQNLGTVDVRVYRVKRVGIRQLPGSPGSSVFPKIINDGIVLVDQRKEAPGKVLVDGVRDLKCGLGPERPYSLESKMRSTERSSYELLDSDDYFDDHPFMIFRMYYRSKEALRALCIIRDEDGSNYRRQPTGNGTSIERKIKTEDVEDDAVPIKTENEHSNSARVKRESEPSRIPQIKTEAEPSNIPQIKTKSDDADESMESDGEYEVVETRARSVAALRRAVVDLTGDSD